MIKGFGFSMLLQHFLEIWRSPCGQFMIYKSCRKCLIWSKASLALKRAVIMRWSRTCSHLQQVWMWADLSIYRHLQVPVHPRSEIFWLLWAKEPREKEQSLRGPWIKILCPRKWRLVYVSDFSSRIIDHYTRGGSRTQRWTCLKLEKSIRLLI